MAGSGRMPAVGLLKTSTTIELIATQPLSSVTL